MVNLGFKSPSIISAVGGGWVFAAKSPHRYRGVVKEGKARLSIFKGLIKNIAYSVHPGCRVIKRVGYSFKSIEEEIETLIQIAEVAYPVVYKNFGSYGIPIIAIVFRLNSDPIILNFD
jgi:hypothetical protein